MRKRNLGHKKYCKYEDFISAWQGEKPSLEALCKRGERGSFPKAYRPGGVGPPVFETEAVVSYLRREFGFFWPDVVWEIEKNLGVKR